MNACELIEASAGTGKTQKLAERLIELLSVGVHPWEMVALTFSRAAAGEIFERFVTLLAERALASEKDAQYLREVIATQHLSQIGTLDSFLLRMVKACPDELGLLGPIEMMDDFAADRARAGVSFSVLRRTDERSKRTFFDAFSLAMNGKDVRSFTESYRDFVKVWHERVLDKPEESAWGDPVTIWGKDIALAHMTDVELASAALEVEKTFPGDKKWADFAAWVYSYRGGSLSELKGYAAKLLANEDILKGDTIEFVFGGRTIALSRAQTIVVREAILAVFGYLLRMKLELARGIYRLVSAFESTYGSRVRKTGKLIFSDVPRLLASLGPANRLALEYRMDSTFRAWAIDEFQDTSREQWKVLANLLDEAKQSGGEKSVFIVGDRKQAIYGWRNGDVSIFEAEAASGFYAKKPLNRTYRLGPTVVEAVNRVFARGRILTEFPAWKCGEHESAAPERLGFVRVSEATGRFMKDFVEPVYLALKATLGDRLDDPRRRGVTAAVLVRDNSFGRLLANQLKALGMEGVVWEGERNVLDTPALAGFLDLLQLADHPGDLVTYRHFRMTRLAAAKYPNGVPDSTEVSREMSQLFTSKGIVRTLIELRALLPADPVLAWSHFTEERFADMLRAAGAFERMMSPGSRLADFAAFLASHSVRTVAEPGRIRILTIHRSKGLGFDYVVLPLYEKYSLMHDSDGPLEGKDWFLPDPKKEVARAIGGLESAYELRRNRSEQESLCAYYVAMTRAKRALSIVLHPESATALRFSDLVRSADLSDLTNASFVFPPVNETTANPSSQAPLARPVRAPRTYLRRKLPSLSFAAGVSAGSLFTDRSRKDARALGTDAHKRAEQVEFSATLPKPEGFVALWRERPFEILVDGEWVSGRFDRVTFFQREDGLHAEIIDFKASIDHPERYAAQLASYEKAVAALTGLPRDHITSRLMKTDQI